MQCFELYFSLLKINFFSCKSNSISRKSIPIYIEQFKTVGSSCNANTNKFRYFLQQQQKKKLNSISIKVEYLVSNTELKILFRKR